MKIKINHFLTLLVLFVAVSCNSTEPPSGETLTLTLEDVSCTEAWMTLSTNLRLPTTIELKQNNQNIKTVNLTKYDSLIFIASLLPSTSYTFQASNNAYRVTSNQLQLTTLDTTSHNFSWQTWTFGEHSSSVLYDVAIIDENSIYAVGEIYMNDSIGQPDPTPYNAVHWDGTSWTVVRIPTKTFSGTTVSSEIRTIFSFSENDIWTFSIAGSYSHWNGNTWESEFVNERDGSGNEFWGTNSTNLYLVCNEGGITFYNGQTWQKLESGTDVDIQDIWGIDDGSSDQFILCAASNAIEPGEYKILRIINSNYVDTLGWISNKRVHSVWMDSKYQLFACGDGVFKNNSTNVWEEQGELTFVFTERVRGTGKNDVFVVGHFGLLAHYNGASWKEYPEASSALVYTSLDFKNNLMVTVGYTQTKAVIQFMIRN